MAGIFILYSIAVGISFFISLFHEGMDKFHSNIDRARDTLKAGLDIGVGKLRSSLNRTRPPTSTRTGSETPLR
jgi:hypothetical protein